MSLPRRGRSLRFRALKDSIRTIAAFGKTSSSNVYNYFEDKHGLFAAVVEGTIVRTEAGFAQLRAENSHRTTAIYTFEAQEEMIGKIMAFVFGHQDDLRVLLFFSLGSSRSGFKNNVTKELATVLVDWAAYAAPEKEVSTPFVGLIAGLYVNAIEQMVAAVKEMGAKEVIFVNTNEAPFIPTILKLPFMIGSLSLIYGEKE